jgi:hypothetical protein
MKAWIGIFFMSFGVLPFMPAFSDFFDPRRSAATPPVKKILRPWPETQSTLSEREMTLFAEGDFEDEGLDWDLFYEFRRLAIHAGVLRFPESST